MSIWQRVDGALFDWHPDRPLTEFLDYLELHRILACVDSTEDAQTIRLRFLVDDEERVAVSDGEALSSGIDLQDLIEDIGASFAVTGYAGEHEVVAEDAGGPEPTDDVAHVNNQSAMGTDACGEGCGCHAGGGAGLRAVTILRGGVAEVASLSRSLDEPIVVRPLEARSAILTEEGDSFPTSEDWPEVPSLQIYGAPPRFAALYEDAEAWVAISWEGRRALTPANLGGPAEEALQGLARDEDAAELLAAMGGGDVTSVEAALHPVTGGPAALIGSLGLSSELWEFLAGERAAHEVEDVVVITPPSRGESLGYLVDDVLPEAEIVEKFVGRFSEMEREHPVATRAPSATAVAVGGGLLALGLTRAKGVPRVLLVATGGAVIANGLLGLSVAELVRNVRANRVQPRW